MCPDVGGEGPADHDARRLDVVDDVGHEGRPVRVGQRESGQVGLAHPSLPALGLDRPFVREALADSTPQIEISLILERRDAHAHPLASELSELTHQRHQLSDVVRITHERSIGRIRADPGVWDRWARWK